MTPLAALLETCYAADVRLGLAPGNSLTIDAPEGALSDELLDRLRESKPALLSLLKQEEETRRLVRRLYRDDPDHVYDEAAWQASRPVFLLPSPRRRKVDP